MSSNLPTADLDARLAEIDQRLREVQAELGPDHDSPVSRGRSGPLTDLLETAPRDHGAGHTYLVGQIEHLMALHASLISSMSEMLSAFQRVLGRLPDRGTVEAEVTVSAGPFTSTDAVRAFERALSTLPGVSNATLRGYEGEDRAVFDVQLSDSTT